MLMRPPSGGADAVNIMVPGASLKGHLGVASPPGTAAAGVAFPTGRRHCAALQPRRGDDLDVGRTR